MENAVLENVGPNRMGGNRRTGKRRTRILGVEKAGLENAGTGTEELSDISVGHLGNYNATVEICGETVDQ